MGSPRPRAISSHTKPCQTVPIYNSVHVDYISMRLQSGAAAFVVAISMVSHALAINKTQFPDRINLTDHYIVTLKPGADVLKHINSLPNLYAEVEAREQGSLYAGVTHHYEIDEFKAYAAHLPSASIKQLQGHPDVESVESDSIWSAGLASMDDEELSTRGSPKGKRQIKLPPIKIPPK